MSLPPEQLEQLLNEYLDDALSGERLATVETAVAEDAAIALRLDALRDERAERLEAIRDDPRFRDVRLSPNFTQRVVEAAAAARSTDPLLSPAPAAPVLAPAASKSRAWVRPLSAIVGIAAAVLIAVSLFPNQNAERNTEQEVAQAGVPSVSNEDLAAVVDVIPTLDVLPAVDPAVPDQAIAVVDTPPAMVENVDVVNGPAADLDPLAPSAVVQAMVPDSVGPDVVEPNALPDRDPAPAIDPGNSMPLNMVLVYEVTRTALGKGNQSVVEGLQKAGIEVHQRRAVGEDVVGYLQQAKLIAGDDGGDQRATILYIEASGKALDRFMVSMFADIENIAELRWNIATDPPLIAAVKQLQKVPATEVRHAEDTSSAWWLVSGEGEQLDFAVSADLRSLMPLRRQGWNAMGSKDQGPDIQSQLILLVR